MSNKYALGFTTLEEETRLSDVPVQGELPAWLRGTLLRTGPAKYETDQQPLRHWFDGYAMLHAFSFGDGKVSYANQFLASRAYQHARDWGTVGYREFATDPCRSIFKRLTQLFTNEQNLTDNGNVNVAKLADEFVALTEIPLPVAFDKTTLKTTGGLVCDDTLKGQSTTAHPHVDPARGETINFLLQFGRRSTYTIYRMPFGSKQRAPIVTIPTRRPAYIHSFGLTPNYIILIENPLRVNPLDLLLRGRPFIENYRWQAEEPASFILARRDSGAVTRFAAPPFFAFHHVNAFETDAAIIVDMCAYDNADIIKALYLDNLRGEREPYLAPPVSQFRRYTLNLKTGAATHEALSDQLAELPQINYQRVNGRAYRFAYGTGVDAANAASFLDRLVKVDIDQRTALMWQEAGCYPGEPVFVPAPESASGEEDAGLILSVVLDVRRKHSFLLVLDARSFTELARCAAPHHIPFGFHGGFFQ